jgi:hypothetical protein
VSAANEPGGRNLAGGADKAERRRTQGAARRSRRQAQRCPVKVGGGGAKMRTSQRQDGRLGYGESRGPVFRPGNRYRPHPELDPLALCTTNGHAVVRDAAKQSFRSNCMRAVGRESPRLVGFSVGPTGGHDSQKLLPWRGWQSSPGRGKPPAYNKINTLAQGLPAPTRCCRTALEPDPSTGAPFSLPVAGGVGDRYTTTDGVLLHLPMDAAECTDPAERHQLRRATASHRCLIQVALPLCLAPEKRGVQSSRQPAFHDQDPIEIDDA